MQKRATCAIIFKLTYGYAHSGPLVGIGIFPSVKIGTQVQVGGAVGSGGQASGPLYTGSACYFIMLVHSLAGLMKNFGLAMVVVLGHRAVRVVTPGDNPR